MLLVLPLVIPLAAAVLVLTFRDRETANRAALIFCLAESAAIGSLVWRVHTGGNLEGTYLRADGLTSFFLVNIALISILSLSYATGYLRHMGEGRFASPRWFYALVNMFLFTMVGVCLSANLGVLWIMMEATTLASALLVGFYNTEGAVEAGWKYLVVCTVGIAFALFGTIVFYLAAVKAGMSQTSALDWLGLLAGVSQRRFDPNLVRLAFVFILAGYGTKVGFVPMHSWLPDAHAEAPTPVSAMLSAILLNCAMYALMRYEILVSRAVGKDFPGELLVFFGLASIVVAGLLILVQRDLKRMLAYSSVEHMGMIAIGMGLGGALGFLGALLHTFNHSVAKSLLFFGAGSVRHKFGTLRMDRVSGMGRSAPLTTAMLAVGALAIVGMPPFSLFVSEFTILSESFSQSRYVVGAVFLIVLSIVFGGFVHHFLHMACGAAQKTPPEQDFTAAEYAVMFTAGALLLCFGVRIPWSFTALLRDAVSVLQ